MRKTSNGFSTIEFVLVVAVFVVIGVAGYSVYSRNHNLASTTSSLVQQSQTQPTTTAGTTQSINNLTAQDASSESNIDNQHTSSDQSTVQSTNSAASNMGGAYDESNF